MGAYAILLVTCINCGKMFGCNPHLVPSIRIEGKKEPVCRECTEDYNRRREKEGLGTFPILEGAYEPLREEDL